MKSKIRVLLFLLCVTFSLSIPLSAKAASDPFSLNETKLKLCVGNTYSLYLKNANQTDDYYYFYYYPCTWSSSNPSVATVDESGYVTVVGKGKATITAEYSGKKYTCSITASASTYKLSKTEITTKTFSEVNFKMTHKDEVEYYNYTVYRILDDGTKKSCYNAFNIYVDSETGKITMTAKDAGNFFIEFYAYTMDPETYISQRYVASCKVTVQAHGLIETSIGCALGTKRQLTFGDLSQITFIIDDPSIASVTETGIVTPKAEGETVLKMTGLNNDGTLETYECTIQATNPKVTLEKDYVQLNDSIYFNISNNSWYEDLVYATSNSKILYTDDYSVYAVKEGKAKVAVTVDGKKFVFTVEVIDPRIKTDSFLLAPSQTAQLSVVGLNDTLKKEKITYKVGNTNVATISASGKITAKKAGNTLVTVKLGDFTFKAAISVGNKSTVKAVNNAKKAIGSIYSQEKRMQEGYYDCSSLIWRSYKPCGYTFGDNYYAPTAANLAKYLNDNKKVIATGFIDPKKLQPGDLIFYAGGNNGRYKNIYHVSMFTGLTPESSYNYDTGDIYPYTGQIVHASKGSVVTSNLTQTYGNIVMIARPTK